MATRIEYTDKGISYWYDNPELGWVRISEKCYDMINKAVTIQTKDNKPVGKITLHGTGGDIPQRDLGEIFMYKDRYTRSMGIFFPAYENLNLDQYGVTQETVNYKRAKGGRSRRYLRRTYTRDYRRTHILKGYCRRIYSIQYECGRKTDL